MNTTFCSNLITAIATITGVIIGFALERITNVMKQRKKEKMLLKTLEEELKTNRFFISKKIDLIEKIIKALGDGQILSGFSTRCVTSFYDYKLQYILEFLTPLKLANVHLIYQKIKDLDKFLNDFEVNIKLDLEKGIMKDPWSIYQSRLNDILKEFKRLDVFIKSYLDGKPYDLFNRTDDPII